jgi:hypothetical protein
VKREHLTDEKKLAGDTHYRSQFETRTSGGLIDLKKRNEWEKALFGGAYDGCVPIDRPKYGVANVVNDPRGIKSARRYGDCFLELSPAVRRRCTFSGADSGGIADSRLATCHYYAHVLLNDYDNEELAAIIFIANQSVRSLASETIRNYKEVQIHGPVQLKSDIVALHVPKEQDCVALQSFASKHGLRYCLFGSDFTGVALCPPGAIRR